MKDISPEFQRVMLTAMFIGGEFLAIYVARKSRLGRLTSTSEVPLIMMVAIATICPNLNALRWDVYSRPICYIGLGLGFFTFAGLVAYIQFQNGVSLLSLGSLSRFLKTRKPKSQPHS